MELAFHYIGVVSTSVAALKAACGAESSSWLLIVCSGLALAPATSSDACAYSFFQLGAFLHSVRKYVHGHEFRCIFFFHIFVYFNSTLFQVKNVIVTVNDDV